MKIFARPPAFTYKKNHLQADNVPVAYLAEKFGTPLYVYSASTIRERFRTFDAAFKRGPHTICYSVKANSNLSLLKMLAKLGSGFDVVSGGELERVLQVSRKAAEMVVFSGVGKTAPEIDAALKANILIFNVESESELDLLAERAARVKKKARMALRVNPDVFAETHPYISTGLREHKFGVALHEVGDLYTHAAARKYLDVAGVSCHIGSQITTIEPFAQALARIADLVRALQANGHNIRYVDAGGGLGISYKNEDVESDDFSARVSNYANALRASLGDLKVHLLLEPGRSIVGPAGALLTRVVVTKQNGKKHFVIVDAAMNDLLRPSLYSAYHEIVPAQLNQVQQITATSNVVDVVGPVCETGDFFARDRELQPANQGDLLAILDTGAYGMSLASNYNTRPRAAEVMVDGTSAKIVRKRETIKDLLRQES
ncbi:MAG: diaminopimelate decarboxylase [Acidobacteriaceae bacterium]|nr:diaminopimelate decarboxylase [Acidobacteriaceae bacterium]